VAAYSIDVRPRARRSLRQLDPPVRKAVAQVIDSLATDPRPPGFLPLTGLRPYLRVRSGDYRSTSSMTAPMSLPSRPWGIAARYTEALTCSGSPLTHASGGDLGLQDGWDEPIGRSVRDRTWRKSGNHRSRTGFVYGFVHETRRDRPMRGRRGRPARTSRRQSVEVNAVTGDGPRRQRQTSYYS
jgi:hypothetical protein